MKGTLLKKKQPSWIAPMLAKLVKHPFSDSEWIFEKKFDGIRCLAFSKKGKVNMFSRNKLLLNATYPKVHDALEKYKDKDFIIDGEIVHDYGKLNSFSKLQKLKKESKNIRLYVFDLLVINGYDLTKLPLIQRKKILRKAFNFNRTICFTEHRKANGLAYFKELVSKGFEGVIAKSASSFYTSKRSINWLKIKNVNRQEFVVCGYTKPQGSRKGFGAILIGFYKDNNLQYAGKVGTGFDQAELKKLFAKLKLLATEKCPFKKAPKIDGRWVRPKLVVECSFTEWTDDNKLRHPSYLGVRSDISAKSVKKE